LGDPEQRARFEALYEQTRNQVRLDENHNFYIDQMGNVALRLPTLEIGRRLVRRGCIDQVNDVFMLTTDQFASGLSGVNYQEVADLRRAEMARWARLTPPEALGEAPAVGDVDPLMTALIKLEASPSPARTASRAWLARSLARRRFKMVRCWP